METYTRKGYSITLFGKWDEHYIETCKAGSTYFYQSHGTSIKTLLSHKPWRLPREADGGISRRWVNSLAVYADDCQMIAILWNEFFTVIHAGRRGLKYWIIDHAVKKLCRQGELLVDIDVVVGPCIKGDAYVVGDVFPQNFPPSYFFVKDGNNHFRIDQYWYDCLVKTWVLPEHITVHPDCTYQDNEKRHSRRKNGKNPHNRMVVA